MACDAFQDFGWLRGDRLRREQDAKRIFENQIATMAAMDDARQMNSPDIVWELNAPPGAGSADGP